MNHLPKVSVVCNVYNHEKYLRDALEGFVMQKTDFPFEVLVHDDASTDGSAAIIREFEAKYPDIIKPICQTENQHSQGILINKTFQIPRIQGKYVAVCEGDDYWTDPEKLQKQYDFMENHPDYTMCTASVIWLNMRTGKTTNQCRTDVDRDISLEEIILETKGRPFQYASFFMKREIFAEKPDWAYRFGVGDTPLAVYAAVCGRIRMLADPVAVYRNRAPGSWTSRIDQNVKVKTGSFEKMIVGLTAFNEATEYRYDPIVSRRIKMIRYNIARAKRDLKEMRSGELREIYEARSFKARMSDILMCKAPRVHSVLRRIL